MSSSLRSEPAYCPAIENSCPLLGCLFPLPTASRSRRSAQVHAGADPGASEVGLNAGFTMEKSGTH